jgi:hypothetical protein
MLKTSLKFAQELIIGIVRFISRLTRQEETHPPYKNARMNERWQIYRNIAFEEEDSDAVRSSMRHQVPKSLTKRLFDQSYVCMCLLGNLFNPLLLLACHIVVGKVLPLEAHHPHL